MVFSLRRQELERSRVKFFLQLKVKVWFQVSDEAGEEEPLGVIFVMVSLKEAIFEVKIGYVCVRSLFWLEWISSKGVCRQQEAEEKRCC